MSVKDIKPPEPISKTRNASVFIPEVDTDKHRHTSGSSRPSVGGILVSSKLRSWVEASMMNYLASSRLDMPEIMKNQNLLQSRSDSLSETLEEDKDFPTEKFPKHLTPLLNENNYWGCYYAFPEYYADAYSPVVRVRHIKDVAEIVGGVLTRDMVAACLTYLRRNPILGDFVYIKLDLSSKHLINIDIMQHYKFLVYLDLTSNLITELTVLSHLPYLQYLSVDFNRLDKVLDYETPQWFLSEVHYKYNSVKRISDLSSFWSITILDLSHNNIKGISGLEQLRYLRRLDLSFNHIQRFENLNHLRLLWLDLSYNNISSFEFGPDTGLWTLHHLEYLNINENNLTSMKILLYSTRLRELHARNNRLASLLEVPLYMGQLRRLVVLDLRANPICAMQGYKRVVINTLPSLLNLDAQELDPVEQRSLKMEMSPDVFTFATRRLLRLLYIQQLSRALISPFVPPADSTDVPLVVLVGHEASGKGSLARRLASECSSNITLAYQHTTASYHFLDHFKTITRRKFDDMLLAGDFLTYTEMNGQSYGLSREEAFVRDGKVRIVNLDLVGALMLKLRGYRPYLILATCQDKKNMARKQQLRKRFRNMANRDSWSLPDCALERSTLQVLLSGRIIITGILNEILMELPEQKETNQFIMESKCSLLMDSDAHKAFKGDAREANWLALLSSTPASSLEDLFDRRYNEKEPNSQFGSLYSLYKESQTTEEYQSNVQNEHSVQGTQQSFKKNPDNRISHANQTSFVSSTYKAACSSKSSKSVTFTSQEVPVDTLGMMVEAKISEENISKPTPKSVSVRAPWLSQANASPNAADSDLWFAFLTETGLANASECNIASIDSCGQPTRQYHEEDSLMEQMELYEDPENVALQTTNEDYEEIHRQNPGLFWDTVNTDNMDDAFHKVRRIIKDIVNSQKSLKPMFNIDFANLYDYPSVQERLINIRNQIAKHQLFH